MTTWLAPLRPTTRSLIAWRGAPPSAETPMPGRTRRCQPPFANFVSASSRSDGLVGALAADHEVVDRLARRPAVGRDADARQDTPVPVTVRELRQRLLGCVR